MKKFSLYVLVGLQVLTLIVLVILFESAENNGDKIKLVTKIDYGYKEGGILTGDIYVDYDINKVPKQIAEDMPDLNYSRPIYVSLKPNEQGIFEVNNISEKKIHELDPKEVVLNADYNYRDEHGNVYVSYGFQIIESIEKYGNFKEKERIEVEVLIGKWGQQKITNITKINK